MRAVFVLVALLVSLVGVAHAGPVPRVSAVTFSSDGTLFVGHSDGAVERWRLGTAPQRLFHKPTGDQAISSIVTSSDGQFIATVSPGGVRLWDAEMTDTAGFLPGACAPLAFGPTGSVLAARTGKRGLSLWGMQVGKMTVLTTLLPDLVLGDLSADGLRVATAGSGEVRVWSLKTGTPTLLTTIKGHGRMSAVRSSPDGRLVLALGATAPKTAGAFAFDAQTGKEVGRFPVGTNAHLACISADGIVIAVTSREGDLTVAEAKTGTVSWTIKRFSGVRQVANMALSPDGRWLATAGAEGLRVWDTRTGKAAYTLR